MTGKLYIARSLLAVAPLLLSSSMARAQSSRVFVAARTGNDANTCNNVATPCQTFAGAITQVNAGGEIIVLESGGYGPITITKAVNINAPAGIVAFIHPPSGDAITISAGASDTVILRGLTLNGGAGNGIFANGVGQLFVERCTITGYVNNGITFVAPGGTLFMRDDDVRKCNSGLYVGSSGTAARAVVRDSYFSDDTTGVLGDAGSIVSVSDSVAAGNSIYGFVATTGSAPNVDMTLERVQAVSNGIGISAQASGGGAATLRFSYCLVTQNTTGVSVGAGTTVVGSSPGTSLVAGNAVDINTSLGAAVTLK